MKQHHSQASLFEENLTFDENLETSPPNSAKNFPHLQAEALQILKTIFGYQQFRAGQGEIIQATLEGCDSLVVMATGNGKSLCYQIPALYFKGLTLVVSPLISLMQDQVDQLRSNGINADFINSSQSSEEQQQVQTRALNGELKLLYVSPEKILSTSFFHFISRCEVSFIAIDEAHCISQWGHDFRPEYTQLANLKSSFANIPIMALTATADTATRQDILHHLNLVNPYTYIGSFERPNLSYTIVEKTNGRNQLWQLMQSQTGKSTIVYCNSRKKVENLTAFLQSKGLAVGAYHAGMESSERERVQQAFQQDNLQIIVATIAFGMGINKPNVRLVVHFDLPRSVESYYQETGRAGRDGLPSKCVLFYKASDYAWLRQSILDKPANPQQEIELQKLQAMADFADSLVCRRQILLNYFSQPSHENCNNCDICLDPPQKYDGLLDAQKIMSTIYRTGQNFGVTYVIEVLRGMQNQKIMTNHHHQLQVYGLGKDKSKEYWQYVLGQLIHLGLVQQNFVIEDFITHSQLRLTPASKAYLRGEKSLELALPRSAKLLLKLSTPNNLNNFDRDLFERLRFLRKQLADQHSIPPYIIFSDATLQEMARLKPRTPQEMLQVNGVGEKKLTNYGEQFLKLITEYL